MGFLKRNILFVDDDPTSRRLIQAMLTQSGFHVSLAKDGFEAFEMLEKYAFDLVLLDIMMPNMSGYDFLKRLRLTEKIKDTPVIMLTAKDDGPSVKKAKSLGADDYIVKPAKKDVLLGKIENILGGRPRFAELNFDVNDREALSELVFPACVVSIGEAGVVVRAPVALEADSIHLVRSPIFRKLGLETPALRVVESQPDKLGYLNYFSYVGLTETEISRIREWVVKSLLTQRSA